jgi:ketosteroid isomerase-like protein
MIKKIGYIIVVILAIALAGCEAASDSESTSTYFISEIIYDIRANFNNSDIDPILNYYDEDFLHNGKIKDHAFNQWQSYYTSFTYMEIENLEIEIDDDEAIATFQLRFTSSNNSEVLMEPGDDGFMSYFKKINGEWLIYGNQQIGNSIVGFPLKIISNPSGAQIYLNENRIFQQTPVTLQDVPSGDHNVRLFLPGYNETRVNTSIPSNSVVDVNLVHASYPYTEFYDFSPAENEEIEHANYTITGLIRIKNSETQTSLFPGGEVILNFNGQESVLTLNDGQFRSNVNLKKGTNRYFIRSSVPNGNTGMSDIISFNADF